MKLELDKYGIQMPAFNKIGGLLANELSLDEAAGTGLLRLAGSSQVGAVSLTLCVLPSAHAAVIAINKAVDRGDVGETAVALRNPAALLIHLQEVLTSSYQEVLQEARRRKAESAAGQVSSDW